MTASQPEPDPYFPNALPNLTGEIWARALAIAFHIPVKFHGGRIEVSAEPRTAPPCPTLQLTDILRHWDLTCTRWSQQINARRAKLEAVSNAAESLENMRSLITEFEEFVDHYFNGVVASWIEWARTRPGDELSASAEHALARLGDFRRVAEILQAQPSRLSELSTIENPIDEEEWPEELVTLLDRWGAWSSTPEDFSRPYPRERPATLVPVFEALLRSGVEASTGEQQETAASRIVALGELDNSFKYEYCYLLRQSILAMAVHHPKIDEIAVWQLSLHQVESCSLDDWMSHIPIATDVDTRNLNSAQGGDSSAKLITDCVFVSPGRAEGRLWDGSGDLPADEYIFLGAGLAAGNAWAVVGSAGVLVAQGSLADHCAILARELGIPCVVSGEGFAAALSLQRARLDSETGHVVLE